MTHQRHLMARKQVPFYAVEYSTAQNLPISLKIMGTSSEPTRGVSARCYPEIR